MVGVRISLLLCGLVSVLVASVSCVGALGGQPSLTGQIEHEAADQSATIKIGLGPDSKFEIVFFVHVPDGGKGYEYETSFHVTQYVANPEGFVTAIAVRLGDEDVAIEISKTGPTSFRVGGLEGVLDQLMLLDRSESLDLIEPYVRVGPAVHFEGSITPSD